MADHFYSGTPASAFRVGVLSDITVATSTTSGAPLEVRVTDAAVTREQIVEFLERMSDYFTVNPLGGAVTE